MKRFPFRAVPSPLVLLFKRAIASTVIGTAAAVAVFGSDDIPQADLQDVRQSIKQGNKHVRRGEYAEAEKIFDRVVKSHPQNSEAKLRLAFVYLKQRRIRDSYNLSYSVAKSEPENSYAFAVLGATLLSAGKFAEARIVFTNSLNLDRKEALAWAGYGMLDFYENRIQDSLNNLNEAVFRDPDGADYVFALAQVCARAEKYKEAADAYQRFLQISRNTDDERRARIKGLINFLRFLGQKQTLYIPGGADQTTVPIELVGNRPVIRLRLNDRERPLNFVLDTGSGISVISDETAKLLDIDPITRGGYAKGIGGDGRFEIVYGFIRRVEIGDVNVRNVPVYIRKFHTQGQKVDGYIGLSLISKFLTTIDYGDLKFTLLRDDAVETPAATSGVSLPLRLTSSGFLSGEVQLQGIDEPLNFIVDTGASVSVISDDVANLETISSFARDEKMRVVGSAGITEDVPSYLLPKVSFGTHTRESITAIALDLDIINEASGFEQAGILGGNFLRNYRMTFDFKNSKVTFVPIAKAP